MLPGILAVEHVRAVADRRVAVGGGVVEEALRKGEERGQAEALREIGKQTGEVHLERAGVDETRPPASTRETSSSAL